MVIIYEEEQTFLNNILSIWKLLQIKIILALVTCIWKSCHPHFYNLQKRNLNYCPPLFDNWAWLRKIRGYALEIVGGQWSRLTKAKRRKERRGEDKHPSDCLLLSCNVTIGDQVFMKLYLFWGPDDFTGYSQVLSTLGPRVRNATFGTGKRRTKWILH